MPAEDHSCSGLAEGPNRSRRRRAAVALEAHLRFTVRAQVRPDELIALLIPEGDSRTTDVERTLLWAEVGGCRLDPLELLHVRTA